MICLSLVCYCNDIINNLPFNRIQMQSNNIRSQLKTVERQIHQQLLRIDRLLTLLDRKKTTNNKSQRNDECQVMENTGDDCFCLSEQTYLPLSDNQEQILDLSECELEFYRFMPIQQGNKEEIHMGHDHHYDPTYIDQISLLTPKSKQVETKFNWISNYLDQADCKIQLAIDSSSFYIIGAERGKLLCKQCNEQFVQIESQSLNKDTLLNISFPSHMQGYHLKTQRGDDSIVYELTIQETTRILLQILNTSDNISRIMLLREENAGEKYQIVWGNYSLQSFIESLILEPGTYILLPLSQKHTVQLNLYFKNSQYQSLKADIENPVKTYNLLVRSFEECGESQFKTLRLSSEGVKRQFIRSCYMDLGIIIEIYQNIHQFQALFVDDSPNKQDIALLFPQIYSPQHQQNRLKSGQKVIKFYSITLKPARLFVPKKKVLMGNRIMDNITVHSIFQ